MDLNWSSLNAEQFEKFCFRLLECCSFTNLKWYGDGGGDKGRDILATKALQTLPLVVEMSRWVVQCKRYTTKRLSKQDISAFLTSAREHNPDHVLLIVTRNLTADTKDWIESVRNDYRFRIHVWEEHDIERLLRSHRRELSADFPNLISPSEPIVFGTLEYGTFNFHCREFDEIQITVFNKATEQEAREELIDFLDFVHDKRIEFQWTGDNNNTP